MDVEPPEVQVCTPNYRSALDERDKVEAQIREEIANGRYMVVQEPPLITSALGAIPKSDGGVRIIQDASRPDGNALNDFALKDKVSFQTVDDATANLEQGDYQAVIDLKLAYRVCRSRRGHWRYAGLQWTFNGHPAPTYMVDTMLGFGSGAPCQPSICLHRVSHVSCVTWVMWASLCS